MLKGLICELSHSSDSFLLEHNSLKIKEIIFECSPSLIFLKSGIWEASHNIWISFLLFALSNISLSWLNLINALRSSACLEIPSSTLLGIALRLSINLFTDEKLRSLFLHFAELSGINLWSSILAITSWSISFAWPVTPNVPSLWYLPALPAICANSVSYTHLTLPTILLV